jgi:glutamyl-tRNA reductase
VSRASLVVVGLSHRTAPVELREQLAVPAESLGACVKEIASLPGASEAMLVATCNRVEAYVASESTSSTVAALRGFFAKRAPGAAVDSCLYEYADDRAVRHVFRVAASLDSMVVGEPQILGQVKEAYAAAESAGALGPTLRRAIPRAFSAAKRVRNETGIANGRVSVASVAVDLATQIFGSLSERKVLLLGAGKMALGAARALVAQGAKMSVANRSYDRAVELARSWGADAHPLDDLSLLLTVADVVLCSTGASRYVLTLEDAKAAMKVRRGRPLFVVDIAVPRNVDPRVNDLDGAYVYDVDDLEREVARALSLRGGSLAQAEQIVDEEIHAFERDRRASSGAGPTIAALREHFRAVARAELERSLSGKLKHLGAAERAALEAMVDATVNKLLHAPMVALRSQAASEDGEAMAAVVRALFRLSDADDRDGS